MKRAILAVLFMVGSAWTSALARADAVEDAMKAEVAFAQMAQDKGVANAFAAYAAPGALRFVPGVPNRGVAEIHDAVAKDFADGGKLNWEPKEGLSSKDGSIVILWGRWVYQSPKDDKGQTREAKGTYLTVWQKQPDGSWKWTHDIGNSDPKPKSP